MQSLMRWLRSPGPQTRGLLLFAGLVLGVVFWGGFNTFMEWTNTMEFWHCESLGAASINTGVCETATPLLPAPAAPPSTLLTLCNLFCARTGDISIEAAVCRNVSARGGCCCSLALRKFASTKSICLARGVGAVASNMLTSGRNSPLSCTEPRTSLFCATNRQQLVKFYTNSSRAATASDLGPISRRTASTTPSTSFRTSAAAYRS